MSRIMISKRLPQFGHQAYVQGMSKPMPQKVSVLSMAARPVAAVSMNMQTRAVTTSKITPADSYNILVEQRKHRPTSPHLMIYQPQIPWILSALNRVTGCLVSGGFYIFGAAYLVSPLLGWHMDSVSMAAAFGAWPVAAKVLTKLVIALPFTFHSFNGLRHLAWDMGKSFANKTVVKSGWIVVGVSTVSALYLALFV